MRQYLACRPRPTCAGLRAQFSRILFDQREHLRIGAVKFLNGIGQFTHGTTPFKRWGWAEKQKTSSWGRGVIDSYLVTPHLPVYPADLAPSRRFGGCCEINGPF